MTEARLLELRQSSGDKMRSAQVDAPAIQAFLGSLERVCRGENGLMPESSLTSVGQLPSLDSLPPSGASSDSLLNQLAVIKLNGGLGTGMGLDRAKSLMAVKGDQTFLDFIARHLLFFRRTSGASNLTFLLMNSFSTARDTRAHLERYPELGKSADLDFLQSKAPKIDAASLEPVRWPANPELEWCPPGHGDIYPSLVGSGVLARLVAKGIRYLFVSNSDNLGASVDLRILQHFADSGSPFLMEVAMRTASDRKGGHLARREGGEKGLVLREAAQCPESDQEQFQNTDRHRFFNTNNLWIRLDRLEAELSKQGGALPLPLIRNVKTVDPRDAKSTRVLQLETAMGAAIECFSGSTALVVPRDRFAPVKTTADLMVLRSDACIVTEDFRLELAPQRNGTPPDVDLDSAHYKFVTDFDRAFPNGVPSLLRCRQLKVKGPFVFEAGVEVVGDQTWVNPTNIPSKVSPGRYGSG